MFTYVCLQLTVRALAITDTSAIDLMIMVAPQGRSERGDFVLVRPPVGYPPSASITYKNGVYRLRPYKSWPQVEKFFMGWIKDAIGYSSAGTLGFIVGGVPGAFAGISGYETIKDAKYTWQSMRQSGKRRRGSTGSVGGTTFGKRTPKKRRTRLAKKRKVQIAINYAKGSGSSNNLASASRKIGYVRRYGKRPVKVSNWLRQKIKKVIETDKLVGRYTHVNYFQLTPGKPFAGGTDDMQSYEYAGILTETAAHTNRVLYSPIC